MPYATCYNTAYFYINTTNYIVNHFILSHIVLYGPNILQCLILFILSYIISGSPPLELFELGL